MAGSVRIRTRSVRHHSAHTLGIMKPLFLLFLLLVACGCDKAAKKDARVLDAILANRGVDHIDCFGLPFSFKSALSLL